MNRLETPVKSHTTLMQNPNWGYYVELLQKADEAHQEIVYVKYAKSGNVYPPKPIDLQKALRKTDELEWKYRDSMSFSNERNKDAILFCRHGNDEWYVEVPIFTEDLWDGYFWYDYTDTKHVLDMIRLFFEEVEWFDMLDFKMARTSEENVRKART